jgi:hypothetical protein
MHGDAASATLPSTASSSRPAPGRLTRLESDRLVEKIVVSSEGAKPPDDVTGG